MIVAHHFCLFLLLYCTLLLTDNKRQFTFYFINSIIQTYMNDSEERKETVRCSMIISFVLFSYYYLNKFILISYWTSFAYSDNTSYFKKRSVRVRVQARMWMKNLTLTLEDIDITLIIIISDCWCFLVSSTTTPFPSKSACRRAILKR